MKDLILLIFILIGLSHSETEKVPLPLPLSKLGLYLQSEVPTSRFVSIPYRVLFEAPNSEFHYLRLGVPCGVYCRVIPENPFNKTREIQDRTISLSEPKSFEDKQMARFKIEVTHGQQRFHENVIGFNGNSPILRYWIEQFYDVELNQPIVLRYTLEDGLSNLAMASNQTTENLIDYSSDIMSLRLVSPVNYLVKVKITDEFFGNSNSSQYLFCFSQKIYDEIGKLIFDDWGTNKIPCKDIDTKKFILKSENEAVLVQFDLSQLIMKSNDKFLLLFNTKTKMDSDIYIYQLLFSQYTLLFGFKVVEDKLIKSIGIKDFDINDFYQISQYNLLMIVLLFFCFTFILHFIFEGKLPFKNVSKKQEHI